jgi:hypothetical protein
MRSVEVSLSARHQSEVGGGEGNARDSGVQVRVPAIQTNSTASASAESRQDEEVGFELDSEFEELLVDSEWDEEPSLHPRELAQPPPPPTPGVGSVGANSDDDEFSGLMALDVRRNLGFGDLTPHMFTPCPDQDESQQQ